MLGEVDSEGMIAGSAFVHIYQQWHNEDDFLMFPGASPVRQIPAFFCSCRILQQLERIFAMWNRI
jgi:hypothetical protein